MVNKIELENLKLVYLKMLDDINIVINKLNIVTSNVDLVSECLINYYMIDDTSGDKGKIAKSKLEIEKTKNFLMNNVKNSLNDLIIQIDQQLNS